MVGEQEGSIVYQEVSHWRGLLVVSHQRRIIEEFGRDQPVQGVEEEFVGGWSVEGIIEKVGGGQSVEGIIKCLEKVSRWKRIIEEFGGGQSVAEDYQKSRRGQPNRPWRGLRRVWWRLVSGGRFQKSLVDVSQVKGFIEQFKGVNPKKGIIAEFGSGQSG